MFLNSYAIPNLICFVGLIALAFFVFKKKQGSSVGLAYLLLCSSAAAWQIGTFSVLCSNSQNLALLFCRLTYVGSLFIPATTYHFVIAALGERPRSNRILWAIYLIWFLIFLPLSQSPWFITGVYHYFWGYWWHSAFPHLIFLAAFTIVLSLTFFKLIGSIKMTASPLEKKRLKYLFIGLLIAYIGAIDYVPNYGIEIYPFGYIPIYLHLSIYAYAIVRYRFLDIEVIVRRTLVFAGIVTAAACVISIPAGLIQLVIGRSVGIPPFWLMVSGIATAVLIYRPLERRLVTLTDRFLFQKKYNYHKLLKENSRQISLIKSLDQMAKQIVTFLIKQGRIKNAGIFMQPPDQKHFELKYPLGYKGRKNRPSFSMENDHPLVKLLTDRKAPLVLEKLQKEAKEIPPEFSVFGEVLGLMKRLKAEVIIPSFLGTPPNSQVKNDDGGGLRLRNLLVLGPKKSDEEYTEEDLDVFFTIAQDSAVAAENARLYDEAVERTKELEKINRELKMTQSVLVHTLNEEERSRRDAEAAKEEALRAKKKTEEMELELIQRERNKILGEMTGGVAHEMRHPLQYTVGSIHFIKKALPDLNEMSHDSMIPEHQRKRMAKVSETVAQYLEMIKAAASRINSIVLTLETFAKRNQPKLSPEEKPPFQPIDFKFLMNLVLEELRFRYQSTNHFLADIEMNVERDLPAINGDQNELVQVFTNLISNAHDAMEKSPQKKLTINAYADRDDKQFVHLEFRDTGSGIPDALKSKVWDYLFTTKEKQGGSGMGLSWCKSLIEERHDGKIWFESTAGVGTTFHIKIPAWVDESELGS